MMREEDFEIAIKVVIVGNGAVGKSSMIQRYCKGIFTRDYKKTIGVDFLERELEMNGEEIRLMLWDTAGQEEFDSITKAYYRGAQGCVLAYSTTDRDSFEAVESWKRKVENEVGTITTVLVQNKIDLKDKAVVTDQEAEELASRLRVPLFRTSVKENFNIESVFESLTEDYLEKVNSEVHEQPEPKSIGPNLFEPTGAYNGGFTRTGFENSLNAIEGDISRTGSGSSTSERHKMARKNSKCMIL